MSTQLWEEGRQARPIRGKGQEAADIQPEPAVIYKYPPAQWGTLVARVLEKSRWRDRTQKVHFNQ